LQLVSSSYLSTKAFRAFVDGFEALLHFLKVSASHPLSQHVSSSYLSTTTSSAFVDCFGGILLFLKVYTSRLLNWFSW
jgi:hypothetical protein